MKEIEAFISLTQEAENEVPVGQHKPQSALAYVSRGYAYLARARGVKSDAHRILELRRVLNNWNRAIDIGLHTIPAIMKNVDADLYYRISLTLLHTLNDQRKAIDDFTRVIKINNRYVKAYTSRGEGYAKLEIHQHAIDDFTQAIELGVTTTNIYGHRGRSYEKLGQYKLAANDFTNAIERNPNICTNYYNRANAYRLLGQLEQAIADYRRVIKLAPNSELSNLAANRLNDLSQEVEVMKHRKPRKAKRWIWFR